LIFFKEKNRGREEYLLIFLCIFIFKKLYLYLCLMKFQYFAGQLPTSGVFMWWTTEKSNQKSIPITITTV